MKPLIVIGLILWTATGNPIPFIIFMGWLFYELIDAANVPANG